jgi:putative transposase
VAKYLRGGYGVSERRACRVTKLQRGTYRYESYKDPQAELRMRMREIAAVRVRYGCRKILVLLQREGWQVGKSRVSRLYREEGLTLRRTVPRKRRVAVERRERIKPTAVNQVWSLDFVADQLADGRRFRSLTVVDVYTRESLAIEPGQNLKSATKAVDSLSLSRGDGYSLFLTST